MSQHLKNPIVLGALAGTIAVVFHYVNQKIVKKKEKVDMVECAKIFVVMSACLGSGLYFMKKKNMLPFLTDKQIGGSASVNANPVGNPVSNVTPQMNPNVSTSNSNTRMTPMNLGGGNTISSMNPQAQAVSSSSSQPDLVISDINDVIHTGTPNF